MMFYIEGPSKKIISLGQSFDKKPYPFGLGRLDVYTTHFTPESKNRGFFLEETNSAMVLNSLVNSTNKRFYFIELDKNFPQLEFEKLANDFLTSIAQEKELVSKSYDILVNLNKYIESQVKSLPINEQRLGGVPSSIKFKCRPNMEEFVRQTNKTAQDMVNNMRFLLKKHRIS